MVTPCHCPPVTVIGRSVQRSKTLPFILQPTKVASKKSPRRKSQPMNALSVWVLPLNRQLWNTHRSNTAPAVVASLRSTSVNVTSTWRTAPSSSAYQSSPLICCTRRT